MFKNWFIVLGLIAAASAVPIHEPIPEIVSDALMFNASVGAWNPAAAVSYAKANCGSGPGLCAEFASRAIAAGGAGNPVITWVPTLQSVRRRVSLLRCATHVPPQWLVNNGWRNIGSACCGPAGSIVIYDTTPKGMDHAAFSMGGGLISQHNPYRCRCRNLFVVLLFTLIEGSISIKQSHAFASCSTSGAWGTRRVYCKGC